MRYRDEGRSPGLTDLFRRWERLALVPPVCGRVRRGAAGPDYYAATPAIAIDATGQMVLAYTFWTLPSGTKGLYVRTSNDGGDSSVPQVASGSPGDFRLAWQDDRTDEFNTWSARGTDGGANWGRWGSQQHLQERLLQTSLGARRFPIGSGGNGSYQNTCVG